MASDVVGELSHDHEDINRRVLAIAAGVRSLQRTAGATSELEAPLTELRDLLFLHFAREEEGLFPFVQEVVPDLAARVHVMEVAHDTICGSLARMVHLASTAAPIASLASVFERFEGAYAVHSSTEAELLVGLRGRLNDVQRNALAELVKGL